MDKIFTAACVLITILVVGLEQKGFLYSSELMAGWLGAFLNHIFDSGILLCLDRVKVEKRLKVWLILTSIKFAVLLGIVAAVLFKTIYQPIPFIYTFLIAYFFFFIYHVAKLYRKFLNP